MEQKNARWVMEPSLNIGYMYWFLRMPSPGPHCCCSVTGTRSANETGIILAVHVD